MTSPADDEVLRRLDAQFDEAFDDLSRRRIDYEDDPRDPERIARLGEARIRLEDARAAMRAERQRLGLELRVTPEVDDLLMRFDGDAIPRWRGVTGSES